jgi:hypothetical protein
MTQHEKALIHLALDLALANETHGGFVPDFVLREVSIKYNVNLELVRAIRDVVQQYAIT